MSKPFYLCWLLMLGLMLAGCGGSDNGDSSDNGGQSDTATDNTGQNPPKQNTGPDQSSPDVVFNGFKEAMAAKDWKGAIVLATPDSQAMMAGGMMFGAGFMTFGDEDKEKSLKELLKKHNIDTEAQPPTGPEDDPVAVMKKQFADVDVPTFFAELVDWMGKNSGEEGSPFDSMQAEIKTSKLTDVKIDGNTATGTVSSVSEGEESSDPAVFTKLDGKWYIDFVASEKMKQKDGPKFPNPKSDPPATDNSSDSSTDSAGKSDETDSAGKSDE